MKVMSITPILNVTDVPASIAWFERIGWCRGFTWNPAGTLTGSADRDENGPATFAGLCANRAEEGHGSMIFLCKDGQGSRDPDTRPNPKEENYGGVWMSWWVKDVDACHAECVRAGVEIVRPPVDEPWGVREFLIRHPDGHYFRVSGAENK